MYVEVSHSEMKQMQEIIKLIRKRDKYVYAEITNIEGNVITYRIVTKIPTTELMQNYFNELV